MRGIDSLPHGIRRGLLLLEQCREGDVVLDRYGHAWQRSSMYWYRAYGDDSMVTAWELAQRSPFKRMQAVGLGDGVRGGRE